MSTTITSGVERWLDDNQRRVPLAYDPFPRQQAFHASPAKYRLFGGAAGPGKSKALLMETIVQAHEHPNSNTLLLRRTFPELEQNLLLYFRRDVPRELYKTFNESKHVVEWLNGSTTRFGYCAAESDVYQYQGAEFLFIGIDELTLFTLRQWQFLTSRNRCPVPGAFPCMAGATNPGNIGHAWVKSLWIDKQPAPGMEDPSAYDPADYDFIPARVSDNPIYAGDEQYLKTLRALPSHLKRAFLDGDWDVFAGQYFDKFDTSRHVVRAEQIFANLRDKPWLPRWISIDWGFEHPAAVYWHAAIPAGSSVAQTLLSVRGVGAGQEASISSRSVPTDGSVGAQQEGPPGRPLSVLAGEPGGSVVPGADACIDAAHSPRVSVQVEGRGRTCPESATADRGGPAENDGREAPSLLPQAVAEAQEGLPGRPPSVLADEPGRYEPERHARPSDIFSTGAGLRPSPTDSLQCEERTDKSVCATNQVVTYREYVTHRTPPRDLAREIIARSLHSRAGVEGRGFIPAEHDVREAPSALPEAPFHSSPRERTTPEPAREKIDAIYLSPDAFACRTDEASIAEQMGDVFAAAGLPRPIPADDDRVGGWMLMYQLLDGDERGPQVPGKGSLGDQVWRITDNCIELIRTLPNLVRDSARVEDVEKMDGDDPADAARYGLKSRYGARSGDPNGWRSRMPLADRLAARALSADPTIRAIQARKAAIEESRRSHPVSFLHRRR